MSGGCYVCGSPELAEPHPPGGQTCSGCLPARDHIVSNQTGNDGAPLAVCPCGWRYQSQSTGRAGFIFREVAVLAHWRAMISASAKQVAA